MSCHRSSAKVLELLTVVPISSYVPDILHRSVEDGPSLTHGNLTSGAAEAFCQQNGMEVVDPEPYAVGEVSKVLRKYPALRVIPNIGYRKQQVIPHALLHLQKYPLFDVLG